MRRVVVALPIALVLLAPSPGSAQQLQSLQDVALAIATAPSQQACATLPEGDGQPAAERHIAPFVSQNGPIRRSLEKAFGSPVVQVSASALGVDAEDATERIGIQPPMAAVQTTPPLNLAAASHKKVILFAVILLLLVATAHYTW